MRNIEEIRSQELHYIRMSGYVTTIFNLIAYTSPFMVTCLTFTLYIFFGGEGNYLTAEKAFVSVALFNMLRVPLAQIPNMATSLMLVSEKRRSDKEEIKYLIIKSKPFSRRSWSP